MRVDVDINPEDICDQFSAKELASAIQFRKGGKYLGQFLDELYTNWGLHGGEENNSEFRKAVKDKNRMLLAHACLNGILLDDSVHPEIIKLTEEYEEKIMEIIGVGY